MYKGKAWTFLYLQMIFIIPNFNICMNLPWSLIHVLIFSLWADICEFLDKTASCKCEYMHMYTQLSFHWKINKSNFIQKKFSFRAAMSNPTALALVCYIFP